ncbi:MAG TPA: FHA domain-containing protein [Planctomycetota bacterium]|nr:FHA domain-containing protein [Planctomycetota bacterium]
MRQIILTVTREERVIQQFAFAARTVTIGRVVENDVVLDHPNVSRMHAEISAEDGKLFVDDLGSANGTLLNGRRVDRAEVRHRDVLAIGPFKLHVAVQEPNAERPTTNLFGRAETIRIR